MTDQAPPLSDEFYGVTWLRELCDKAGKGTLNNVDARCVWRIVEGLLATIKRDRAALERCREALTDATETLEWLALHSPDCYGWEGHEDPGGPWPSIQVHARQARKALASPKPNQEGVI